MMILIQRCMPWASVYLPVSIVRVALTVPRGASTIITTRNDLDETFAVDIKHGGCAIVIASSRLHKPLKMSTDSGDDTLQASASVRKRRSV